MHTFLTILALIAVAMIIIAVVSKPGSVYTGNKAEQNPVEGKKVRFVENESEPANADGVRGHLEVVGDAVPRGGFYDHVVKRILDIVLSLCGLVVLSPVFLVLCIAIVIDDPGPIFFVQKRVGRNKQYFKLHKFRSMKMSTPHDVPTHLLENPDAYITKVGRFLRKSSLDELPQIWEIFTGKMSIVGPRPALWNQFDLIAERDKYGANDIRPGLTGLAQINGRDELEIPEKARFDGEYASVMQAGSLSAFLIDVRCFLRTIDRVLKGDGVIEGKK